MIKTKEKRLHLKVSKNSLRIESNEQKQKKKNKKSHKKVKVS